MFLMELHFQQFFPGEPRKTYFLTRILLGACFLLPKNKKILFL
jgi:hypothetical protein